MKLWEFGHGKNIGFYTMLDELRQEILKSNPDTEAQTWKELKIKRRWIAKRKLKDTKSGIL